MINYRTIPLDFREVAQGDTFEVTLQVAEAYPILPGTRIVMDVRPVGDYPELPVLTFDTADGSITTEGQQITLRRSATAMHVRAGRFVHDMLFITAGVTSKLYQGRFDIIATVTTT